MTLIAFACYPDRIETITDTASYTRNVSSLGQVTKQMPLPHLDAIVMCQGHGAFGMRAKLIMLEISEQVATFDQLIAEAPRFLRSQWREFETAEHEDGTCFVLGYSPDEEAWGAWMFTSEQDFAGTRIEKPFLLPAPFSLHPSELELQRANRYLPPDQHHLLDRWMQRPEFLSPASTQEWVDTAKRVRDERALEHFMRIIVAGRVFHTVMRRGRVTTRQVHQFSDHGDEFLQLVAWTQHPQAQLMPCHCGSGKPFVECHLAQSLTEPCGCGSGTAFRECCMAPVGDKAPVEVAR